MPNKKTLKTYHGIPKTPIDDNTVFYASLDGTTTAEVGDILATKSNLGTSYVASPTGLANMFSGASSVSSIKLNSQSIGFPLTCDMVITPKSMLTATGSSLYLSTLINGDGSKIFAFQIERATLKTTFYTTGLTGLTVVLNNRINIAEGQSYHIRFIATTSYVKVYVNGVLSLHITGTFNVTDFTNLMIGQTSNNYGFNGGIADLSVSNVDRGNYFPTLSKDLIDGNARISSAFNPQRNIFSDVITSEYSSDIVKGSDTNRPKQHTVTQAVAGTWASADTIKVKGLAGEMIGSIVDSDTALAKITQYVDGGKIGQNYFKAIVDSVNGLVVNDTVMLMYVTGSISSITTMYISSIDTINNVITVTWNGGLSSDIYNNLVGGFLTETTASSSTPLVKFNNAGTITTVVGTWSNLGTNQATFTLGTNVGLTNQDLQIEYSLNMIAGQGQIEVLTTTLGGEIIAKKYDPSFTKLSTDFNGKVSGSVVENPNIFKTAGNTTLFTPAQFVSEETTAKYNNMTALDGVSSGVTSPANLAISQQLFSFDLVALVERKYGTIPASTLADKIAWLKANTDKITCNWYGYGSNPTGNKAYLTDWVSSAWNTTYQISNTANTPTFTKKEEIGSTIANMIDSNGFVHFIAYTDASNGTIASVISTDYVSLDITLKYEAKQTLLAVPYSLAPRKLVVGTIAVRDDFKGKISGSTVENPHISKANANTSVLQKPTDTWQTAEDSTPNYSAYSTLDSLTRTISASANGNIAEQLFSFNLIRMVEDKYGVIPALDKVAWLKANISSVNANWYGYGTCPSGNKSYLTAWIQQSVAYASPVTNSGAVPTLTSKNVFGVNIPTMIDSNGFAHFLAYTDASDGVTASTIYTDYINLDVTLITPTGFDVLVPENPRRDDGQSNILLVRKETREIQAMFSATNEDGIVSYGEYIPQYDTLSSTQSVTILAELDSMLITDVTSATAHLVDKARAKIISNILKQNDLTTICRYEISELPISSDTRRLNVGKKISVNATGFYDYYEVQSSVMCRYNNFNSAMAYLVNHNGTLKLLVITNDSGTNNYVEIKNSGICMLLDLPERPLTKIPDGRTVAKLLETPLRNGSLANINAVYDTNTNTLVDISTWGY